MDGSDTTPQIPHMTTAANVSKARAERQAGEDRTMSPSIVVHAFALYGWNVQPSMWVSDVFGWVSSNEYHLEKLRLTERGILAFYASLDEDNQAKLVRIAMDKYSHEAEARAIRTDRHFKLLADNGV